MKAALTLYFALLATDILMWSVYVALKTKWALEDWMAKKLGV